MEMILTAAKAALTGLLGLRKKTLPLEKAPENAALCEAQAEQMPHMSQPEASIPEYSLW